MHIVGVPDADGNLKKGGLAVPDGTFVCDDPRPARSLGVTQHVLK